MREEVIKEKNRLVKEKERLIYMRDKNIKEKEIEVKRLKHKNSQLQGFGLKKSQKIEFLKNKLEEVLEDFSLCKRKKEKKSFTKVLKRFK